MTDLAQQHWQLRKPAVSGTKGVIATQHYAASEVGANVLREGGNAVDAAIAAGLAIGTVEPWSSGIGGGGYMTIYTAATDTTEVVEFGMRAPFDATSEDYPLAPEGGITGAGTFNWPAVKDHRNVIGASSVAVPGYIKGVSLALSRHATLPWEDLIEPACQLAERGLPVDWFTTMFINGCARSLRGFNETNRVYFRDGFAVGSGAEGTLNYVPLGALASTYRTLQSEGPDSYYTGSIAQQMVEDLQTLGSRITLRDMAEYEARVVEPLDFAYRDARIQVAANLTAGPSLQRALNTLSDHEFRGDELSTDDVIAYVEALRETYDYRLVHLGEGAPKTPGCTSHLAVADQFGNVVSLTQTIMSQFGSHIMLPRTGILMNNGMMWFDPRPGGPNSVIGGRRPLCNMCPTLIHLPDNGRFALGACGGRKILASIFQLTSFVVDLGKSVDEAVHTPRVDVSGNENVWIMDHMSNETIEALKNRYGRDAKVRPNGIGANQFAVPQIVHAKSIDEFSGGTYVPSPQACAIGV